MSSFFRNTALIATLLLSQLPPVQAQENAQPPAAAPTVNLPNATRISVDLFSAPITKVSEALYKATGVSFTAKPTDPPASYTLTANNQPFWEVFRKLSEQNALVYRPTIQGVEITPIGPNGVAVPMLVSGPVLMLADVTKTTDPPPPVQTYSPTLEARGFRRPRVPLRVIAYTTTSVGDRGSFATPPQGTSYYLNLAAIADPRLMTTTPGLNGPEVLDENGKPIKILEVQQIPLGAAGFGSGPRQPGPSDFNRINYWVWRIALAAPENGAKTISSVKGAVNFRYSTKETTVKLDDIENKHHGENIEVGGGRFTLQSFSYRENRSINGRYTSQFPAADDQPGGAMPLWIELQNSDGQPLIIDQAMRERTDGALSAQFLGTNPFHFTPPFNIVLKKSEKTEPFQAPFEFKAIALP